MKETVAGEYAVAAGAAPPTGGARLEPMALAGRSQIVWGEHCSECAYPACYSSCAFYDPRPDLNCRRFVAGIEDAGAATAGRAMRIRFRKWGKLEGRGPVDLRPPALAARREEASARYGRRQAGLPLPFHLKRSLAYRIDVRAARRLAAPGIAPHAFVVEGWSNDGGERAFTLTLLQEAVEGSGGTWQGRLTLRPTPARQVFPLGPIASAIALDRPFLVQIEPVGEAQGVDVTLALADFVAFQDPAAALAGTDAPLAKVLVWDLDETLWTGTLAEDGPDGVTPRPAAVAALVELDRRGVLHSIASKNDPAEAEAALKRFGLWPYFLHPQVGWGPKSRSVAAIAAALDLGLDSFVFVDDQPFERAEVAAAYPSVRTLEHHAVGALAAHPWFDHPATPEAGRRRSLYQAEAARGDAAEAAGGDYVAFLRTSELELDARALDAGDVARVHAMVTVIALASSKGGSGKSTTVLALASAFALDDSRVGIVDGDRSGRLKRWADAGTKPALVDVAAADDKSMRRVVETLRAKSDVVLIDVEGSANLGLAIAVGLADLVIVPANPSAPDVEDGLATVSLVRDLEASTRRTIPHGLVWTRVPSFRSREIEALTQDVKAAEVDVIGSLSERTAYKSLFSYSTTLSLLPKAEVPGVDKALAEARQLAENMTDYLNAAISEQ